MSNNIDLNFLSRLENWRRVYKDRKYRSVSITFVFCQYLKATHERAAETEDERERREREELMYRPEPLDPPDFKDADLINLVWQSMPDYIESLPVKKFIKTFVFGTARDYERMRKHAHISLGNNEHEWRMKHLRAFYSRVQTEEEICRQLHLMD